MAIRVFARKGKFDGGVFSELVGDAETRLMNKRQLELLVRNKNIS